MPGEQQERLPQLQVQLEPQQLVAALQVQPVLLEQLIHLLHRLQRAHRQPEQLRLQGHGSQATHLMQEQESRYQPCLLKSRAVVRQQ